MVQLMATSSDYIAYVVEKLNDLDLVVSYKKMFGEYMVYLNQKPIFLVCDNTVFIKKHECLSEKMKKNDVGIPYRGAKEHYIVDVDQKEEFQDLAIFIEPFVSLPKPRKKKT